MYHHDCGQVCMVPYIILVEKENKLLEATILHRLQVVNDKNFNERKIILNFS